MNRTPEQVALKALVEELKRELSPVLSIPRVWLNEDATSQYLGMSVHSFRAWRSRGSGGPPYHKVNGRVLYHRDDLDRWVRRYRVEGEKRGAK